MAAKPKVNWKNHPREQTARKRLAAAWGISETDVGYYDAHWSVLNDDIESAISNNEPDKYHLTRVEMVRALAAEGKYSEAKRYVPECIYVYYAIAWNDTFYTDLGIEPPAFYPHPEIALFSTLGFATGELREKFFGSKFLEYWKKELPANLKSVWNKYLIDENEYHCALAKRNKR